MTPKERTAKALAALPASIKIGGCDIQLVVRADTKFVDELRGLYSGPDETIYLSPLHGSSQRLVDTLLHEVLHALYLQYSLRDADDEEQTVSVLATGLTQVHRDNPWLTKWIGKYSA